VNVKQRTENGHLSRKNLERSMRHIAVVLLVCGIWYFSVKKEKDRTGFVQMSGRIELGIANLCTASD
jgi:hypothetical protein